MIDNNILFGILILLNVVFFILGYIIGKGNSQHVYAAVSNKPESFLKQNQMPVNNNIKIDDKKYVTNIDTKGLEKKYDSLGETSVSQNDTIISVNKLKNLKR
jgi:hypothetical protein